MSDALAYTFEHVHVYCTNLAASKEWFVDKIGAELTGERETRGTKAADLKLGGAIVYLREEQPNEGLAQPGPCRFGTDHMGLSVPDIDAAVAELKARGVEFEGEIKQIDPTLRIAFMRGPDMVRVELLERK